MKNFNCLEFCWEELGHLAVSSHTEALTAADFLRAQSRVFGCRQELEFYISMVMIITGRDIISMDGVCLMTILHCYYLMIKSRPKGQVNRLMSTREE